jgi:hypothetical protein
VIAPNGTTQNVALSDAGEGRWTATLNVAADGLYRVQHDNLNAMAAVGAAQSLELRDVRPRQDLVRPAASASGGRLSWLSDGVPQVRRVRAGAAAYGSGWIGFTRRDGGQLLGVRQAPLWPAWASLLLVSALLAGAWWRERG